MDKSQIDPRILEQIRKLEEKYEVMGQDISSYLDGLLYSDFLTYWDYIHLDTLLSLQNPKTRFKDEVVFIIYHQITELYFRLILWEIEQIHEELEITDKNFLIKMKRVVRYFMHLSDSFDVMTDGMDKDQFLKFRMSLLPASGFQSAQYRLIEIASTDFHNLVGAAKREEMKDASIEDLYDHLYWKGGSTELATGKKTLTLKQFERKYGGQFIKWAYKYQERNLLSIYLSFKDSDLFEEMSETMKKYDVLANIFWPLAHMKSASRYLYKDPDAIKATGGTNWQKYLPPNFQKVIFFPELWDAEEQENWGKKWVLEEILGEKGG